MIQIHEFDPVIYPRLLWIAVGDPSETEEFKAHFDNLPLMDPDAKAQVDCIRKLKPDVRGGIIVRFKNKKEITTENIAHESVHVAAEIFEYIGAFFEPKNQEPFAYLCGWVAECMEKVKQNRY